MNIYRFINSRDIRKYLENIKYEFNALEASWLVYQCRDVALEEKKSAWNWIIDNMPDMEVHERVNCSYRKSLHDTLRKYMAMNDDLLNRFSAKDGVYTCRYYENGRKIGILCQEREVFFSLDDCNKAMEEFLKDDEADEEYRRNDPYVAATRHYRDEKTKIEVTYDSKCRVKAIEVYNNPDEEYFELISQFFDGFWFDFPTPFKKGDIVYKVGDELDGPGSFGLWSGICVLTRLFPWSLGAEEKKKHYTEGKCGDNSDMTYYGYFQYEDGTFYHECNWTYMDLEYYRGPLNGVKRACRALSSFLKGDIDIGLFSIANRQFILEKQEEIIKEHCHFTDEGLRLAGLLDTDEKGDEK